jgi:aryl-alcohol dehydrogenase-like predicted oxidoreductase
MEYTRLGTTGTQVSRICLGCMTYGVPERGAHPWTLPEAGSRPLIKQAVELGINFFDTSNSYSDGTSEEIVGRALREFAQRDEIVVATKCFFPLSKGPNRGGLSRKAIMQAIDASLTRLGMDYVDLYQIHRWDYATPIEETLEALHDVVKAGKARYIGASSMYAWQFAKALFLADRHGWTRFVTMQNHYNLLNREEEREMLPLCLDQRVGGAAVEPAGSRPPDARLGRAEQAHRDGRGRQDALRRQRAGRPQGGGHGGTGREAPRHAAGADRPCLGAEQAGGDFSDNRRLEAAPPDRRGGRASSEARTGRDRRTRSAVRAARHRRFQVIGPEPEAP